VTKLSPGNKQPPSEVTIGGQPISVTLDEPIDTNSAITSPLDQVSEAVEVIDYAHHEVHEGDHYTFSAFDSDLDDAAVFDFIVTTPDTTRLSHITGTIIGALHTDFHMYEDTTHTTNVQQSTPNNNRNSVNTAGTTVHTSNDDNADGTLLFSTSFGIDTGSGNNLRTGGGGARAENEWMLKRNTKYLFRITSHSANNNVALILSWYEHVSGV